MNSQSQNLKLRLFMDCFGVDRNYFKKGNYGRPGFFPKQLRLKYNINLKQAFRLSYTFNYWLDLVDGFNIAEKLRKALRTCTWQFSQNTDAHKTKWYCRSVLCPWCRSSKLMKALSLYKSIKDDVGSIIWREGFEEERKKIFRKPEHKTCLLALRHVYLNVSPASCQPVYTAAYYIAEEGGDDPEEFGLTYLNWALKYKLDTVMAAPDLYRVCNNQVKSITYPDKNV